LGRFLRFFLFGIPSIVGREPFRASCLTDPAAVEARLATLVAFDTRAHFNFHLNISAHSTQLWLCSSICSSTLVLPILTLYFLFSFQIILQLCNRNPPPSRFEPIVHQLMSDYSFSAEIFCYCVFGLCSTPLHSLIAYYT
jgi:hypothetical protein